MTGEVNGRRNGSRSREIKVVGAEVDQERRPLMVSDGGMGEYNK